MDEIKRYVHLKNKVKTHEQIIDNCKFELQQLEQKIIESFIECGIQKMTVDGQTVYIKKNIWAKIYEKQKAIDMLKASDYYNHYVQETLNINQLSALVREFIENEDTLPQEFNDIIGISETYKVKVLKGG